MKPLILLDEAEAELREAIAYFDGIRPGLGKEFEDAIKHLLDEIRMNPWIGAPDEKAGTRYFVERRFRYVIHYQNKKAFIRIVAIAHGSRRPRYWQRRLK